MSETLLAISLVDVSDLKNDLRVLSTETTWDDLLVRVCNGVTHAIERYCGRAFMARQITESIDGTNNATLYLRAPIIWIDSITNDGTTVNASDYKLYNKIGKLVLTTSGGSSLLTAKGVWSPEPQAVVVAYRHGYEKEDMPQDVLLAARLWGNSIFATIKDDSINLQSRSEGDLAKTFTVGPMPDDVLNLIRPLKGTGRLR